MCGPHHGGSGGQNQLKHLGEPTLTASGNLGTSLSPSLAYPPQKPSPSHHTTTHTTHTYSNSSCVARIPPALAIPQPQHNTQPLFMTTPHKAHGLAHHTNSPDPLKSHKCAHNTNHIHKTLALSTHWTTITISTFRPHFLMELLQKWVSTSELIRCKYSFMATGPCIKDSLHVWPTSWRIRAPKSAKTLRGTNTHSFW